jgi:hypothetical protein
MSKPDSCPCNVVRENLRCDACFECGKKAALRSHPQFTDWELKAIMNSMMITDEEDNAENDIFFKCQRALGERKKALARGERGGAPG